MVNPNTSIQADITSHLKNLVTDYEETNDGNLQFMLGAQNQIKQT